MCVKILSEDMQKHGTRSCDKYSQLPLAMLFGTEHYLGHSTNVIFCFQSDECIYCNEVQSYSGYVNNFNDKPNVVKLRDILNVNPLCISIHKP